MAPGPTITASNMSAATKTQYGQLRWTETLGMLAKLSRLPAAVLWNVITTAYAPFNEDRSLRRIILDSTFRYASAHLSIRQMQRLLGTTLGRYKAWTKKAKLPAIIDELGEDARLLWIGPKRLERVVFWSHGGGFLFSPSGYSMSFWRHVQLELEKRGIEIGIALLSYSLLPAAGFPTPLKQAQLGLNFLLNAGVKPQNLQLAGDSAGGNLVLQVLSHMLHPYNDVPEIRLDAPLPGALLISPWTNLSGDSESHTENNGRDYISKDPFTLWGAQILADVPEACIAYVEAVRAPEGWFQGVDALVERVLVTAGGAELLRDDVVVVGEALKKHHPKTELVVQKNGLHEDLYLDFAAGEKKLGNLTPLTVEWLAAGFSS
ncbi:Alpha/Beta hydrolase protein [Mycena metata]|uniref:Alpha/Beta hydrolase protein n=1 Tax=Mycena metata TaxID=1033252 RepID=A0AAD7J4X2_9AGAR|nr:Alpha/Beta hydrolase protein [Mycena metata]